MSLRPQTLFLFFDFSVRINIWSIVAQSSEDGSNIFYCPAQVSRFKYPLYIIISQWPLPLPTKPLRSSPVSLGAALLPGAELWLHFLGELCWDPPPGTAMGKHDTREYADTFHTTLTPCVLYFDGIIRRYGHIDSYSTCTLYEWVEVTLCFLFVKDEKEMQNLVTWSESHIYINVTHLSSLWDKLEPHFFKKLF